MRGKGYMEEGGVWGDGSLMCSTTFSPHGDPHLALLFRKQKLGGKEGRGRREEQRVRKN